MKIGLLGDLHVGISDGKTLYHDYFEKVYQWILDTFEDNYVKEIFQLGDFYDRRKGVDSNSIAHSVEHLIEPSARRGLKWQILVGNHDAAFKNTLRVNSPELLLSDYKHIQIHSDPYEVAFGDSTALIVPWICDDNDEEIYSMVRGTDAEYCLGHLELTGFQMYKGVECLHGADPAPFKKFKNTFSGHLHHRHSQGPIVYVGTPCELTWNDYADPRGIHILDTATGNLEFFQCPFTLFEKVYYDEDNLSDWNVESKFVKLVVQKRTDLKKFDKFVTKLQEQNPHDIKIIENLDDFERIEFEDIETIDVEDTPTLIQKYVHEAETELSKDRLTKEMLSLYSQANSLWME